MREAASPSRNHSHLGSWPNQCRMTVLLLLVVKFCSELRWRCPVQSLAGPTASKYSRGAGFKRFQGGKSVDGDLFLSRFTLRRLSSWGLGICWVGS